MNIECRVRNELSRGNKAAMKNVIVVQLRCISEQAVSQQLLILLAFVETCFWKVALVCARRDSLLCTRPLFLNTVTEPI